MGAMVESAARPAGERARLVLESLSSPVVARVEHRSSERLTVKQALPFLRLESGVRDEEGRRAVIRAVGVSVEGGTPNLVLDLVYDPVIGPADPSIEFDDTLPAPIVIEPRRPPRRIDHTIPFGLSGRRDRAARKPADKPPRQLLAHRRKPEPRIVVEAQETRYESRERTELFVRRNPAPAVSPHPAPSGVTPLPGERGGGEGKAAACHAPEPGAESPGPLKPSFSTRARALASAFWGYWAERRPARRHG